jgi:two-component system cell cycle sensor histidine kinase/response regulator CckA
MKGSNIMKIFKWTASYLLIIAGSVYLIYSAYNEVRERMIGELHVQEIILAKQAARSVENLIDNYWFVLNSLSKNSHIVDMDETGEEMLKELLHNNSHTVRSITRVGIHGDIIYTFPHVLLKGHNLSDQDHIKLISISHKTVFSDVFISSQGFKTTALHVPVFKDMEYCGSVGILIDYDYIAEKYFENIKIGKDGYAWAISEKGIELYSPVPIHIDKTAADNNSSGSSVLSIVKKMQRGEEGTSDYLFNISNGSANQGELYHAAFYPVRLYNTFWSICVTAPESQALSHIQGFRNRCIGMLFFLAVMGIGYFLYLFRFHHLSAEQCVRNKTEEVLRESETRLKSILESMQAGVIVVDSETGCVVDVNRAAADLIGAPKARIVGQVCHKYLCPTEQGCCQAANPGQAVHNSEGLLLAEDGARKHVLRTAVQVELAGRTVLLESVIDITERRQAEQALRDSEERYRRLFEMESDAIILADAETGQILDVNHAASELYGYGIEEMLGLKVFDISAEPEKTALAIRQEDTLVRLRHHKRKDGTVFPVELAGRRSDLGGKRVFLAAIRDITDRMQAEAEKDKLEAQLRQAQKLEAIGTLAGGIAHDFNNILAPIIGYAELALYDGHLQPSLRNNFGQILQAALRAKDLVGQILAFGRYKKEQPKVAEDIGVIVKEALKLLRASLPATVEINHNIEPGFAFADATQIHQVLINLCTNASHAMDGKGVMEVNLTGVYLSESDLASGPIVDLKPGSFLRLSVSDTGCGMNPELLERIFDPYFTTKEAGKGSGLGLAVVLGIVKRHKGAISVQSMLGKGSTFSIYIPTQEGVAAVTAAPVHDLPTGTEKILMADDEQMLLEMSTQVLGQLGYQVTTARDGRHALEIFSSGSDQFDLLITDYTMPGLTGIDLIREIRRVRSNIPAILCSGFAEKLTENTVMEPGVELIIKPFGIKDLSQTVRRVLDARC